jgi:hypothetical protein
MNQSGLVAAVGGGSGVWRSPPQRKHLPEAVAGISVEAETRKQRIQMNFGMIQLEDTLEQPRTFRSLE